MSKGADRSSVVAFVGPSLDARTARALCGGVVLPPARQGDVWRALTLRPKVIALVDGVFEAQPSVWHRELLCALASGVAVYGAASMGALRAAELYEFGMVGVGRIFQWVLSGELVDDSDVALLHADGDHGFRPLTVPYVNVRYAVERAEEEGVLGRGEGQRLLDVAKDTFYQERTWPLLRKAMESRWRAPTRAAWDRFQRRGLPDLKEEDARACLKAAAEFARQGMVLANSGMARLRPSSVVRRRRLMEGVSRVGARLVPSSSIVAKLERRSDAQELWRAGMTRSALAAVARGLGFAASEEECARARRAWLKRLGGTEKALASMGMDEDEAHRLVEDSVLAEALLRRARRVIPDAPSDVEALAQEARWRGLWGSR
jgi:hypothetical protein